MTGHYYAISVPTQMGFIGRREINSPQAAGVVRIARADRIRRRLSLATGRFSRHVLAATP